MLVFTQSIMGQGGHTSGMGDTQYPRPREVKKKRVNYGKEFQVMVS